MKDILALGVVVAIAATMLTSSVMPAHADGPEPLPSLSMTQEGVHVVWPDGSYEHHVVTPSGNPDKPEETEIVDQLSGDDEIIPWGTPNEQRAAVIDPDGRGDVTTAIMQLDTTTAPSSVEGGVLPPVQTVESDAGVSLGWWTPQGRQLTWTIVRNGEQIATTTERHLHQRRA